MLDSQASHKLFNSVTTCLKQNFKMYYYKLINILRPNLWFT